MFSLDVSHSEFNLNSINTDEAIFMDMILAPEVAPEMTHKSEDERSKLIGEASDLIQALTLNIATFGFYSDFFITFDRSNWRRVIRDAMDGTHPKVL